MGIILKKVSVVLTNENDTVLYPFWNCNFSSIQAICNSQVKEVNKQCILTGNLKFFEYMRDNMRME